MSLPIGTEVTVIAPPLGKKRVELFRDATESHKKNLPTLATIFRVPEFQLLDRLQIDWKKLLHAEQCYEYHVDLNLDQPTKVSTKLTNIRTRKTGKGSMTFIETRSEIHQKELCVVALTNFVIVDQT